ncbi:cag pathogenicity island type IV secretion system translocation protein CagH [Helicobacter pylori]|uniref:cag pathogenicity island type IV secretion system translocation protein CagH n=1 Tax=Helicobacter pylori TaxID=210 RepID=UPI0030C5454E
MAGTQAIYESSSAGFLSEISSIISSTSGVAGPFAGIVAGAMSAAIIPIVVGFTNPQMTAIMTQYNQSIAEAVSMPMKAANQQYNQLYQGFNDQSMAVGNNILNISKLTGEFNAQGNTQGTQISAVNSQIASILASNTTPKNPSAIEAYATNQIAVPSVPTTVEMMSGILGNITSAAPKYALALQEQLRSQASNSSMNDTADSLDSCTALGALVGSSKVFFSCMQISMTPMSVSMPTVYAKYQALAANALTSGVNPMTTPACPIGDKVLAVYCYAEKVAEILREYYIEFVKNNTNLLQNASQMILNQSGLATSTYDTQAISNISSLYNYNIVANKSFLKSHLTYLDYIKDKLKGQKDSYLTERVQTKIIVK